MSISVNKLFGLEGDRWMRHANPVIVWTRFGMAALVYGLVELELVAVVSGIVIAQTAKAWFIDRMVLLFEGMKARNPGYAAWEY